MGVEQVYMTKSIPLFLETYQKRKEGQRGKYTGTQSSWMCFTKKRNLLVGKKQPGERERFKMTQREDGVFSTSKKGGQ